MPALAAQRRILDPAGARSGSRQAGKHREAAGDRRGNGGGASPGARFVAMLDPVERYCVFDEQRGAPAEIGSCLLIGLMRADAILLCHLLNSGRVPSPTFLQALGLGSRGRP